MNLGLADFVAECRAVLAAFVRVGADFAAVLRGLVLRGGTFFAEAFLRLADLAVADLRRTFGAGLETEWAGDPVTGTAAA